MCGIAGIVSKSTLDGIRRERFRSAAELSSHRGPDYTGYFADEQVELIHHRLSILDLNERSNQPFVSGPENNNAVLVYNGEIYNYQDLANANNLNLSTSSDTEVLFKLLQTADFDLSVLNGIFAFAFYEQETSTLTLVRDRLGVKPLYYYDHSDFFLFASEAKVIYQFLDELSLNYQALSEFISFGSSVSEQTIINGVKKLSPGGRLKVDLATGKIQKDRYWSIQKNVLPYQANPSFSAAQTQVKILLSEAVKRQCISDVQVGAYLSGGIDSSAVVTLASRYTSTKLNTYSVSFDQNPNSELKRAAKIAKACDTNHHEFEVTTQGIEAYLKDLIFQYDEPFADPAMIPLHLMAEKASNFSRVVLQGDGGDEVFSGYGRYVDVHHLQARKNTFWLLAKTHPKKTSRAYYQQRYESFSGDVSSVMAKLVHGNVDKGWPGLINSQFGKDLDPDIINQIYSQKNEEFAELPLSQRLLYIDMEVILPEVYLEKVDKVNMYHSIEARVPFLDNDLVEYVMKLPFTHKVRKRTTKYFLREALADILPSEILQHRKQSFGTPVGEWLVGSLFDYVFEIFDQGEKAGIPFDFSTLRRKLLLHRERKEQGSIRLLWRFFVLTQWLLLYQEKLQFRA